MRRLVFDGLPNINIADHQATQKGEFIVNRSQDTNIQIMKLWLPDGQNKYNQVWMFTCRRINVLFSLNTPLKAFIIVPASAIKTNPQMRPCRF